MLSSTDDLRVLIVAGDPLARHGLATLLPDETHAADVWTADVCGLLLRASLLPTV